MFRIPISLKKTVTIAALGVLVTAGMLAVGPGAAHADVANTQFSPLSNPFLNVDVSGAGTGDGALVIQWFQTGAGNQTWYRRLNVNGYEEIVNGNSGKCLTTDGVPGHQLYQWRCKGAPGQFWDIEPIQSGWVPGEIKNPASGLVMDVSNSSGTAGAAIVGWWPNGGANQKFSDRTSF